MQLTDTEFNSIKPGHNMLVTKAVEGTTKIKYKSLDIYMDNSFVPEDHQKVVHQVIRIPKTLIYSRKLSHDRSMEWLTDMLLKPGDKIWVNYLAVMKAHTFQYGGETYYFIPYSGVYLTIRRWNPGDNLLKILISPECIKGLKWSPKNIIEVWKKTGRLIHRAKRPPMITDRKEEEVTMLPDNVLMKTEERSYRKGIAAYHIVSWWKVVMLNGFVLFEDIKEKHDTKLWTPKPKESTQFGMVRYEGRPNIEYWDRSHWDDPRIHVGDKVHLAYKASKSLENNLHAKFPDGGAYRVTQRRKILGVVNV